ncbi:paired amphipathic helix protein Sin3a-like [Varroa jacobsoni]|uniref:Paired amphipathic helix protein Sin3b n=1 Tax=Varroa destructor TaxID=109461 RepID=A0A7M7JXY6_VARDE|nr:paired amphipathic helix protein Sin3a-like [Varroa destructor]XP_022702109.1 paired amphipathic helix protein Sin3a-like [Varroa jacobsoni]
MNSGYGQTRVSAATGGGPGRGGSVKEDFGPRGGGGQPAPPSPGGGHGAPSGGQCQRLKVEDALSYLDLVKYKFGSQPHVYNDFLDIMKEFKSQSIDTPGVIQRVSNLFRGHPELIVGFNTFLPPGYKIELQGNEQVNISMPGSTVSHTIHPDGPPTPNLPPPRSPTQAPVEFNHAINYVNKIKNRFACQPDVYKKFLDILHTYQKEQKSRDAGGSLSESEVYQQVAALFEDQDDLLQEFGKFLPDANGAATVSSVEFSKVTSHVLYQMRNITQEKPRPAIAQAQPTQLPVKQARSSSQINSSSTGSAPPVKRTKFSKGEITISDAGKHGTLKEYAFFEKVRKALRNPEVYENFLRCLNLYNQEVVSKSELVHLVTPFLGKFPDLFKWFKDFIGFKDFAPIVESQLNSGAQASNDTSSNQPKICPPEEIDYSACKRYGASYRALPKNYQQPKCSGRTPLCREVLNDTWVSFPSWSEDSTFVSSKKTQFEEHIYRCEDERFELDIVIEANLATIRVLETVQRRINRMGPEERSKFRLDENLGGTSATIHQRAIRRIYGDKAGDLIEGLRKNPVVAVGIVLKRLKSKEEEWREAQKAFNNVWREQMDKYYLRSLDHQGMTFKQTDSKTIRSKNLLNEIDTVYEERCSKENPSPGSHLQLQYPAHWEMIGEASNLIIHYVRRQSGVNKEDKQRIKWLVRRILPEMLNLKAEDMSDDEGCEQEVVEELGSIPSDDTAHAMYLENKKADDSYAMFMADSHWYLFLRLHHILCERLAKINRYAQILLKEEEKDKSVRKDSVVTALRLKPQQQVPVEEYFSTFVEMIKQLLDGQLDSSQFEDQLRELFGINAYHAFTLDKVVQNATRQLQHLVSDETSLACTRMLQQYRKVGGAGGACSTTAMRASTENHYQNAGEKEMANDCCYKVFIYHQEAKVTFEYIDTETNESNDNSAAGDVEKWAEFVDKSMEDSEELRERLAKKPVFLPRNARRRRTAHASAIEKDDDVRKARNESEATGSSACKLELANYKSVFVVQNSGLLYNQASRRKARDGARQVSLKLKKRFDTWHRQWLSNNATSQQVDQAERWMQEGCRKESQQPGAAGKPPHYTYHKYRKAQ